MGEGIHTAEVGDLLERAAARLEKPGAWTQGYHARDAAGFPVGPTTAAAACWCLAGGVAAEAGDAFVLEEQAIRAIERRICRSATTWNDALTRTQTEVVSELRAAAADLRAEAQS